MAAISLTWFLRLCRSLLFIYFLVGTSVMWEGKLWPQCCGGGGALRTPERDTWWCTQAAQMVGCSQGPVAQGFASSYCAPHYAGCSACTQLNPPRALTWYFPLKFLPFHLLPCLVFAQRKERDGWSSDGWPRKGSYFGGLTFRCSHELSRVRAKDPTTAWLCPSRQGNVPEAQSAQLMTCEQRLSWLSVCHWPFGLFLPL